MLSIGSSGPEVKKLEEFLILLGYEEYFESQQADGIFDTHTRDAVIEFQNDHGLEPSGAVDLKTMDTLQALLKFADHKPASVPSLAYTHAEGLPAAPPLPIHTDILAPQKHRA